MTAADLLFLRGRMTAALSLACCGVVLTGCNVQAHDPIDTKAPTGVPIPAAMRPAEKKTAVVVPPPTEADLGLPIYPGAKTYVDDTGTPVAFQSSGDMATAMLETPDGIDQVVDFYKSKLTVAAASGSKAVEPREEKVDGKRKVVLTGNDAQGNVQVVQAREDNNKTIIELMRTQVKALPAGVGSQKTPDNIISGSLEPSSSSPGTPSSSMPSASGTGSMSGSGRMP